MSKIEFKDNSQKVLQAFNDQIEQGLLAIGTTAEGFAKGNCPVDSGRLRNSITYATKGFSGVKTYTDNDNNSYSDGGAKGTPKKGEVYIGTNVEYAQVQEYTDMAHPRGGQAHFLRDAVTTHNSEYRDIMKQALEN